MQVAAEIRRGNVKNPGAVDLDQFKIPFVERVSPEANAQVSTEDDGTDGPPIRTHDENMALIARGKWVARTQEAMERT